MESTDRIYVAGHTGLVGSALMRLLQAEGYSNLITRRSHELDLRCQAAVQQFFREERPQYIFLAAARVGGIVANAAYPFDFLYDNLIIAANVMHAAQQYGVRKLLFLGSSCIYPRLCVQPIQEEALLTGPLEPTNEAYAIAKIAGLKLGEAYMQQYGDLQGSIRFIAAMPTNLYGEHDTFAAESSHVIPALIMKFCAAVEQGDSSVTLWGSGTPRREFLHVDDLAGALLLLMQQYESAQWINVGTGVDCSIAELATQIAELTGFTGTILWDTTRPDGTPRKLLDVTRIKSLGWVPRISLYEGLVRTIAWYRAVVHHVRKRSSQAIVQE